MKKQFIIVSILAYFDSDFECILKADLSDHTQEDMLSQYDKNNVLCSIVYFSQKLNAAESNYEIYDKKLFTIIQCFEQWWSEFKKSVFLVKMLTDHKNL